MFVGMVACCASSWSEYLSYCIAFPSNALQEEPGQPVKVPVFGVHTLDLVSELSYILVDGYNRIRLLHRFFFFFNFTIFRP